MNYLVGDVMIMVLFAAGGFSPTDLTILPEGERCLRGGYCDYWLVCVIVSFETLQKNR